MVANSELSLRERAGRLLEPIDFRFFYDPYDAADPIRHPGQLHVGYRTDDQTFYGHYGMLNTEARIASYLGIARGQLPPEHYYRMFRTLPENLGPQQQSPRGTTRDYYGVRVFEGSYDYRGARIVPSWGGSMFEALMVTLFVPEDVWAPRSWGINHPLYVRAQIAHGLEEVGYGYWGFSPAASPRGGYEVYGVKALGTYTLGYFSYEIGPPVPATPDASFDPIHPRRRYSACLFPRPALRPSRGGRQSPRPLRRLADLRPPGLPGLRGRLDGDDFRSHPGPGPGDDHGGDRQ